MLPPLALAKLPVPNEVLGKIEGSLDFCAQADPQSADRYQERKKAFVEGASAEEVAEARASKEYKENYDAATDEMGKQSNDQVKKACTAALDGKS
jgi:tRNA/tmRNA/rRNA uracil-C5-methylase (TrmA/RlmC/RlmD family)